jgi:hypothetical protein
MGLQDSQDVLAVSEVAVDVALGVLPLIPEFDSDDGQYGSWAASAVMRLEDREHLSLVTGNDEPTGMLIAYDRYGDGSLYCWLAGVVPSARRHGTLSAMMTVMRAWACEHDYLRIRIGTQNRFRGMLAYLVRDDYAITGMQSSAEGVMLNRIMLMRDLP